MTSIMHPAIYASQLATKAQAALSSANSALFQAPPRPMPPMVGIPEQNGPDTPDNPWFIGNRPNPPMPIRTPFHAAASHARTAVQHIDGALQMGSSDMLSRDVLNAFGRAKEQANAGLTQLTAMTTRPVNPSHVKLQFDGASLWLGLAKNLIELDLRHPGGPVTPRPPVTLPVDPMLPPIKLPVEPIGPGEPGSPITIKPIDPIDLPLLPGGPTPEGPHPLPEVEAPEAMQPAPITIQLPHPDSPIQ